jgi:HSP20 family molecular chaperone IbpA
MDAQATTPVPLRTAETILDEVEAMYDQITRRAYEIFLERGGLCTLDLEDWLTAEKELLWKPDVHIVEMDQRVVVMICIGPVRPIDLQIVVTPEAMTVQTERTPQAQKIFRTLHFPRRIDVTKAEASYADGYLVLTA